MGRYFYTHEENEAYREGRIDEERHRHNYERDRYSNDPADEAYFLGRKDVEREERIREEEEEYERQRIEAQERRREEERRRDEEYETYLQMQMEEQMEAEHAYWEEQAHEQEIPPEIEYPEPITEEELFMQIQEDERSESLPNDNIDIKEEKGYSDTMQEEINE